jgi:hypothetical protein
MAMKVYVSDSSCLGELVRDLARGGCLPRSLDEGTLEVICPEAPTAHEARTELTFFLRAWRLKHPEVELRLG